MQSHTCLKFKTVAAIVLLAAALPVAQPARAASQVIGTIRFVGNVAANQNQVRVGQPTPNEVIHSLRNTAFSVCKRQVATVTRVDLTGLQATSGNSHGVWRNVKTQWNCILTN
ncbi:hypothetical protein [Xanthomonas campestris]|uniref:Secreted protein n=1 Tax=Xanthomonas campestris pv. papavericola TaxID=487881 RepID=A0AAJ2X2A1_XANCA|nr:hypothetical protein [Xanthomonas campestris]MEC3887468.1 hypothetical protein [Xanthomonas campestris pv. papavericola]